MLPEGVTESNVHLVLAMPSGLPYMGVTATKDYPMKITKLRIVSTSGANRRPASGEATFDDGKRYDWLLVPGGELRFFTYRRGHGGTSWIMTSFASPARAAALALALEF